jgi:diketogulonate reductase-like aldo/keto reductase
MAPPPASRRDSDSGASSVTHLEENARAVDVQLDEDEFKKIEDAFPHGAVQGERYSPDMMKIINS